jgi:hypothetical protein
MVRCGGVFSVRVAAMNAISVCARVTTALRRPQDGLGHWNLNETDTHEERCNGLRARKARDNRDTQRGDEQWCWEDAARFRKAGGARKKHPLKKEKREKVKRTER